MTDPSTGPAWLDYLAHDLRGPLSPLLTAVDLLRSRRLDPAQHADLLATMERQLEHLTQLIDDTADLLNAGRRPVAEPARMDLSSILDMALVRLNRRLTERGVVLDVQLGGSFAVLCDSKRLTRLVGFLFWRSAEIAGQEARLVVTACRTDDRVALRITVEAESNDMARRFAELAASLNDPAPLHVAEATLHDILFRHNAALAAESTALLFSLPLAPPA